MVTDEDRGNQVALGGDTRRTRRDFLRAAGVGGMALAIPAMLTACGADSTLFAPGVTSANRENASFTRPGTIVLDFKSDVGVLNYAYALEQLEAAFYLQVIATPYAGMSTREQAVLTNVRDHEVIHREFLKAALGTYRIPDVQPEFSGIDFGSRSSVLNTAKAFEDLGVSAYNGAAKYIASDDYLVLAGKIVSVEARHASTIRDLLAPKSGDFASNAFDSGMAPKDVIAAASAFIVTKINVVNS